MAPLRCCLCLCLLWLLPAAAGAAGKVHRTTGQPNVLFIVADDLRDWVGWMGGHPQARTPNLDRLAAQGMRFSNAHCNYALCNPSRTSLLTGLLPSSSGVFGNEQDWRRSVQVAGKPTLPEHLRARGFLSAAAGKIFHANHGGPDSKLAGWHGGRRGFELDAAWDRRFPRAGVQLPPLPLPPGQNRNGLDLWHWDWAPLDLPEALTEDGAVVAWAGDFLRRKQPQSFFLAVGLYRPHSPWYVPRRYFDPFPLDQIQLPEVRADDLDDVPASARGQAQAGGLHERIVRAGLWKPAVQAYLASVAFCDAMLGQLLDALESGPHAGNTIVVFTSDHGWYLGEKSMWHKGRLWEEATRVPLVIRAPGLTRPGSASAQPVALVDLYPTVCDLLQQPKPPHLDGASLLPLLRRPETPRDRPAVTAMGGGEQVSYAARDVRWRYIRYADGGEELYDHVQDPREWTNLAGRAEHAAVKARLARAFPAEFRRASRPAAEILGPPSEDGSQHLRLQPGDALSAAEAPRIEGRGLLIDAAFDYQPEIDADSTLVAQGDTQTGYALHLVAGRPVLSVRVDGRTTSAHGDRLAAGPVHLRAMIDGDGLLSLAVPGRAEILLPAPFPGGFPSQPARGLTAGQSFGPLPPAEFPDSTPWDGAVQRLRVTVLPPKGKDANPATN